MEKKMEMTLEEIGELDDNYTYSVYIDYSSWSNPNDERMTHRGTRMSEIGHCTRRSDQESMHNLCVARYGRIDWSNPLPVLMRGSGVGSASYSVRDEATAHELRDTLVTMLRTVVNNLDAQPRTMQVYSRDLTDSDVTELLG
jgi:hypothetical protein